MQREKYEREEKLSRKIGRACEWDIGVFRDLDL
jgi:hypothetical protein